MINKYFTRKHSTYKRKTFGGWVKETEKQPSLALHTRKGELYKQVGNNIYCLKPNEETWKRYTGGNFKPNWHYAPFQFRHVNFPLYIAIQLLYTYDDYKFVRAGDSLLKLEKHDLGIRISKRKAFIIIPEIVDEKSLVEVENLFFYLRGPDAVFKPRGVKIDEE